MFPAYNELELLLWDRRELRPRLSTERIQDPCALHIDIFCEIYFMATAFLFALGACVPESVYYETYRANLRSPCRATRRAHPEKDIAGSTDTHGYARSIG